MKAALDQKGFAIVENLYTDAEITAMLEVLEKKKLVRQFGIREFLLKHPELQALVFTPSLRQLIHDIAPHCNKAIKSIYFDKPPTANWIVNWHQDLTINVKAKMPLPQFYKWRVTKERVVVQPPKAILENIFTIRIHLDDCTQENGALAVWEGSHKSGVQTIDTAKSKFLGRKVICEIPRGGVLLMKPLLWHASKRTTNQKNRRVIHIEFTDAVLPQGLHWKEKISLASPTPRASTEN